MSKESPSAGADAGHAAVLAIIESLRAYFAARGHGTFHFDLAEDWYQAQLFPPTREQYRRAVRFMHKTAMGGGRLADARPD